MIIVQTSSEKTQTYKMKARSGTPVNGVGLPDDAKSINPDLSILRKPIPTSITGFRETIQAYENGTDEIRNLLANECDMIYECKACRNIFRSLANFISHKRIYCRANFCTTQHFHFRNDANGVDHDVATIVQAEHEFTANANTVITSGKPPKKDLTSVIERLLRREHAARPITNQEADNSLPPKQLDTAVSTANEIIVLQLEKVKNTDCAVFQTVRTESNVQPNEIILPTTNSISAEVTEVHNLQAANCSTLGPDGRVLHDVKPDKMTCDICQTQFDTEKTLRLHIKKYHVKSTYVFPCPACPKTFFKPWAVMQHLSNDHKKSQKRIRQMRDTIMRRRTRISEIQVKGPSRELLRLQNEASQQRVTWPDNYTGVGGKPLPDAGRSSKAAQSSTKSSTTKHTSLCSYCGKTFDRRAALGTHLKSCPSKTSSSSNNVSKSLEADSRLSALQENDESNSNSADSFMAMLNREKSIQAKIHEQEQYIASTKTECNEVSAGDKVPDNLCDNLKLNKNKRKRFKAEKLSIGEVVEELDLDQSWESVSPEKFFGFAEEDAKNQNGTRDPIKPKKPKLNLDDDQLTTDCSMCDRKFANLSNLRRHVAMLHYREKKFGCTLCQFQAFRRVDVLNHLVLSHSVVGDKQDALRFVRLIALDKNKFSVEKDKAIADALIRMQQKLPVGIDLAVGDELMDESSQSGSVLNSVLDGDDIIIPLMNEDDLATSMDFQDIIPMDDFIVKDKITDDKPVESLLRQSVDSNSMLFDPLQLNASQLETLPLPQERQKRRGRPKGSKGSKPNRKSLNAILTPAPYVADTFEPPRKPSKLMRHSSSNSSSSEEQSSGRPVRNRIKAVNKDFVYDMSDLLQTDESRSFVPIFSRTQKRKPIGQVEATSPDEGFRTPSVLPYDSLTATRGQFEPEALEQVKGAALAMAKQSVLGNRACFNKQSEPPAERPIVPAKIIALRRSVGSDWHVMETPSPSPLNRSASNEQIFDKLSRKKQAFDKLNHLSLHADFEPTVQEEPADANSQRSLPNNLAEMPSPRVENFLDELLKSRNRSPAHPVLATSLEMSVKPLSPNVNNNNSLTGLARNRVIQADDLPRRKTLIERLAEIKTKKIHEHMQKLNIASGDENH